MHMRVCMKKPRKSTGLVAEDSSSSAVRRLQKLLTLLDSEARPHGSDPLGKSPKRACCRLVVYLLVRTRYDVGGDELQQSSALVKGLGLRQISHTVPRHCSPGTTPLCQSFHRRHCVAYKNTPRTCPPAAGRHVISHSKDLRTT